MAAADVEFLREVYEEWGRGDFSRAFFDEGIISEARGFVDMDSGQRGREQVLDAQRKWLQQWERPFAIDADEFIDAGELVVVLIRWRGRGRGSGAEVEAEGAHVWELRGGKAVRWDIYRDRDDALAAAELSAADARGDG